MQYTITINQPKALEWGLNSQQALLFAFVYECPSWANPIKTDTGIYFALSKSKIVDELPLLTDKPDTAYRLLKALAVAGLIELTSTSSGDAFRLTAIGEEWNPNRRGFPSPIEPIERPVRRRTSKKPIPAGLRLSVFTRDGMACLRCGCTTKLRLRADHIVPESLGGPATLENLQTLCMSCNSWKGVKTIDFRSGQKVAG